MHNMIPETGPITSIVLSGFFDHKYEIKNKDIDINKI